MSFMYFVFKNDYTYYIIYINWVLFIFPVPPHLNMYIQRVYVHSIISFKLSVCLPAERPV